MSRGVLLDFEDGTANPEDDTAHTEAAVVPDGPGADGSIVLIQRRVHDLDKFAALDIELSRADAGSCPFAPGERALAEAMGIRAGLPISERKIRAP